jgi:hypothetical protein
VAQSLAALGVVKHSVGMHLAKKNDLHDNVGDAIHVLHTLRPSQYLHLKYGYRFLLSK